jgi:hypothetical protein
MISTALDSIDKTQQDPFMATLIKAAFNAQLAADKIKKAADSKDRKERDDLKEEARKILEGLKGTDKIKGTMPSETDAPCGSNRRELLEALKRMVADAEAALGAKPKGGGSRPVPTCPAGQHMTKTGCVANGPGPTPPPGPGPTPKPPTGGGVYAPADDL